MKKVNLFLLALIVLFFPYIVNATTIFSDNFDDGNDKGWKQFQGSWDVTNGEYHTVPPPDPDDDFYSYAGKSTWSNYTFEADVKMNAWDNDIGLVFYSQPGGKEIIRFTIGQDEEEEGVILARISHLTFDEEFYEFDGDDIQTFQNTNLTLVDGRWYHFKVVIQGNSAWCYIDDDLAASTDMLPLSSGKIGLVADSNDNVAFFDNVEVNVEELVLYDNFKGKFIDPNKWEPSGTAERNSFDLVREVRGNYLRMLNRIYAGNSSSVRVKFPYPEEVTAIMINGKVKDLELINCQGNDRIRALRASGFFFNTIKPGGFGPGDATGDVLAAIHVERRGDSLDPDGVLRVIASVFKCLDRNCSTDISPPGLPKDLGEYKVGERIRLLIQWDEELNQFIFQRDNEPEFIYSYSDFVSNMGAPGLPQKRLGITPRVAYCTGDPQPVAFVETRIYKVFVNESAVP